MRSYWEMEGFGTNQTFILPELFAITVSSNFKGSIFGCYYFVFCVLLLFVCCFCALISRRKMSNHSMSLERYILSDSPVLLISRPASFKANSLLLPLAEETRISCIAFLLPVLPEAIKSAYVVSTSVIANKYPHSRDYKRKKY